MTPPPRVRIYSTSWCGFCRAAKGLLDEHRVPYEDVDITTDDAAREEATSRYGWPTIPIILDGERLIGGYTELAKLQADGGFEQLK